MSFKKQKEPSLTDLKTELNRIAEALDKLVYLGKFQLKSAGANIKYPQKNDSFLTVYWC